MKSTHAELEEIQGLALDMIKVQRKHSIPGTERRENVVEHSFSVAMMCWKVFESVKPPLDIAKILKYALAHDFLERGQMFDVNTYARESERSAKKAREALEFKKINQEFEGFEDMTKALLDYDRLSDQEALFVWSVDKMQAIILGGLDGWRPYKDFGVSYEQFIKKGNEFLGKCSPYVKGVLAEIIEESRKTYYDRPSAKKSEVVLDIV